MDAPVKQPQVIPQLKEIIKLARQVYSCYWRDALILALSKEIDANE
jgi:hypothetical protein